MKTFSDYITKIQGQTHNNDHNGAITTMARYVAKKHNQNDCTGEIVKACEALEYLHLHFYHHMPQNLSVLREDLRAAVIAWLTDDEKRAFHSAT